MNAFTVLRLEVELKPDDPRSPNEVAEKVAEILNADGAVGEVHAQVDVGHHNYYDHESKGDPISDLRDALKERGWNVVLAHTGGGCMAVEVVGLRNGLTALVGIDQPISEAGCGGADLEDHRDSDDPYRGSAYIAFGEGQAVDAVEAWLRNPETSEPGAAPLRPVG